MSSEIIKSLPVPPTKWTTYEVEKEASLSARDNGYSGFSASQANSR
jgi:hypothetical protein